MEVAHALGFERDRAQLPGAYGNVERVSDKIEIDLERVVAKRNEPGGQPSRCDVERDVRPFRLGIREREPDLPYDLRVHVNGLARFAPRCERQIGPEHIGGHGSFWRRTPEKQEAPSLNFHDFSEGW